MLESSPERSEHYGCQVWRRPGASCIGSRTSGRQLARADSCLVVKKDGFVRAMRSQGWARFIRVVKYVSSCG
jgi:hypothetical protein